MSKEQANQKVNKNSFKNSLFWQLGISITVFIFLIEFILLVGSIHSREKELLGLKAILQKDVMEKTGKNFNDVHPMILNEEDIKNRMSKFKNNVILLTLLITATVVIGTLTVFYLIAGKHIKSMALLNRNFHLAKDKDKMIPVYLPSSLPNNELRLSK